MVAKRFVVVVSVSLAMLGVVDPASAGWWGKIKKIGKWSVRPITAPTEMVINAGRVIAGQAPPQLIVSPYRDFAHQGGELVGDAVHLAAFPYQELNRRAQQVAGLAGEPGAFVFDLSTFTQRYFNELGVSSGQMAGRLLRESNPLEVIGIPLAAAIRAARERHLRNARPIPDDVRQALAPYFAEEVLARAMYTVGRADITLPNFIGTGNRLMGDDIAVVVDDIIVFSREPMSFGFESTWWTHEMTHVEQYLRWGVESFAYRYAIDFASIEAEADARAEDIVINRMGTSMDYGGRLVMSALEERGAEGIRTSWADRDYVVYDDNGVLASEYYIVRCVFFGETQPVNYLVTSQGRIFAVDVRSGGWQHVGYATPPLLQGVAWTYETSAEKMAVMPDGRILWSDPRRGWILVGQAINLF